MYQTITAGQVWHGEIKNRAKMGPCIGRMPQLSRRRTRQGKPLRYIAIRTASTEPEEVVASTTSSNSA